MKSKNRLTAMFSVFISAFLVLGLAGCKNESDSTPKQPPPVTKPKYVEQIELRPDTTNEFQRVHKFLPNGTKHSMETHYRKGDVGKRIEFYRPDGSVKLVEEYHPHVKDKLKSKTVYDLSGKATATSSYRFNGILESETEYLANGHEKIVKYRVDGKRLHSETIDRKDGTRSVTYYHRDGKTLWAKAEWKGMTDVSLDYYDENGKLTHSRTKTSSSQEITVYDSSGKPIYHQKYTGYWSNSSYYNYSSFQLSEVEVLGDDGKTVTKRIHVERYSNNRVSKVEYFKDGELVREQKLNYDGSLDFERTLNDDGEWQSENHEFGEVQPEPIDDKALEEPEYKDPLTDGPNNFL